MMKKIIGIILTLVLAIGLLAGCGTIVTTNQERDMQQVIIEVNGVKINKQAFYNEYMNYVYTMYYSYGISPDNSSYSSMFVSQAEQILENLIASEIDKQKALNEYKIELTEEEMAEARKEADSDIDDIVNSYAEQMAAETASPSPSPSPSPTETSSAASTPSRTPKPAPSPSPSPSPFAEDLLKSAREQYMNELKEAGKTLEDIYEEYYTQKKISKMEDMLAENAAKVTDAELEEIYNQKLAAQKEDIEEDVTSVEETAKDDIVVIYPEGYRTVKHILIKIDETASSEITTLRNEAAELESQAEEETDETEKAELLKQAEEKNKEADEKLAEELTTIQERSEAILAEVKSGKSFDELILEHNEDTGMFTTDDDGNRKVVDDKDGYLISKDSTSYMENFTAASAALENVGDTSELVATDYGYHIIKMVEKNEGEVPFEDVKDALREEQEASNRTNYLATTREQWRSEAKVVIYKDRLKNLIDLT